MKIKRVSLSLMLGLGLMLVLTGFFALTGRAAPGNPVLNPVPNTHTAPLTTTVSITYDEAIDAATVTSRTFAVHAMQGGLVTATYDVSGSAITVDPVRPFHPGELVQASATTSTLDLSGEGPLAPTVWQFRTAVQGGTGRFGPTVYTTFGAGHSQAVALGDLDGDGDLDAVVANDGPQTRVWLNDGDGTYPVSSDLGTGKAWDVALGDLDGDGDLDAAVAYRNGQAQQVWFNDGSGTFPISATVGGSDSRGVALGDLDGDGDLDMVTANANQAQEVWFNDGSGAFPAWATFGSGDSYDVALGDLDGDGDLDAVVANGSNQAQNTCINDGSGVFTCVNFGAGRTQAVALGDMDGDGDLDAVLAGNGGDPQEIWYNAGNGAFPISTTFGAGTSRGLALGDLDADGDLDVVVANYDWEGRDVWFNGGGSYSFGLGYSWDVALGDVDGDGDLDAVLANGNGNPQEVWLNRSVIYVDAGASVVGADDGTSWADAYFHLQDALDDANSYSGVVTCEIWVAEGVYYPDEDGDGDHANDVVSETFRLEYDGIRLYGGFDGTESVRDARNPETYVTVLSGDVDGNDTTDAHGVVTTTARISGANAYHVLWLDGVINGPITGDTVIDGFTITAGWASDVGSGNSRGGGLYCDGLGSGGVCSPVLSNVTFSGNRATYGGGMYNYADTSGVTSPELTNVTFSGNRATYGGGMYNQGGYGGTSSPVLTDVTFSGNRATYGGGMYNYGGDFGKSSPKLINVTFSGNRADQYGGGMYNSTSPTAGTCYPVLSNVILWGNQAGYGAQVYNSVYANPNVSYSLLQGSGGSGAGWDIYLGTDGGGNIDADPLFVRDPDPGSDATWGTADDDYGDLRLQPGSPAIDAGDNAAVPPGITTDLAGNPRFVDLPSVPDTGSGTPPIVDMGAYEALVQVYLPLVMR
jgi:hypothetical protein